MDKHTINENCMAREAELGLNRTQVFNPECMNADCRFREFLLW